MPKRRIVGVFVLFQSSIALCGKVCFTGCRFENASFFVWKCKAPSSVRIWKKGFDIRNLISKRATRISRWISIIFRQVLGITLFFLFFSGGGGNLFSILHRGYSVCFFEELGEISGILKPKLFCNNQNGLG